MPVIAELIDNALMNHDNETRLKEIKTKVNSMMQGFPLY